MTTRAENAGNRGEIWFREGSLSVVERPSTKNSVSDAIGSHGVEISKSPSRVGRT